VLCRLVCPGTRLRRSAWTTAAGTATDAYGSYDLKYTAVGVPPSSCFDGCAASDFVSGKSAPSLDVGIHSGLTTLAHEIAEATSDPSMTDGAWYDSTGY